MPLYRMPTSLVEERFRKMKDLHPYALLLNQDDVADCDWLEHAAFDPSEAATREKVSAAPAILAALCLHLHSSAPYRISCLNSPVRPCHAGPVRQLPVALRWRAACSPAAR